jgi:hypothetical protein
VEHENFEIVKASVEKGADANAINIDGRIALDVSQERLKNDHQIKEKMKLSLKTKNELSNKDKIQE